jgi:hypothetical protein
MQRLPGLPTTPHVEFLLRRKLNQMVLHRPFEPAWMAGGPMETERIALSQRDRDLKHYWSMTTGSAPVTRSFACRPRRTTSSC